MPRLRRTARIISVAKDTSASATHDASPEEAESEEAEFDDNDDVNLAGLARSRGKQARPPPPPGTRGKYTRTPSSESEESSEESESRGDADPPVEREQFPPGKKQTSEESESRGDVDPPVVRGRGKQPPHLQTPFSDIDDSSSDSEEAESRGDEHKHDSDDNKDAWPSESEEEDSDDDKDMTVGKGDEKKTNNKDDDDNNDSIDSDDRSARRRGKGKITIRTYVKKRNNDRDNAEKKSGLPYANTKRVPVRILPLLQLHSTTTKNEQIQKSIPDTKSISCNMRNFQLARITCESQEDNLLVKLRKETANQQSVLEGDVVVVVSSFTEEMVGDVRPTMRSVSFGEYDGDQSQRHVATALTHDILDNAINWLLGTSSTVGQPTRGAKFDHYIKYLAEKIPNDMSTANLAEFITSHTWNNSQSMREVDELLNTLRQAGGEGPRNSPLTADFNSAARTHDGYKLQRFIHENLAKETKIVIHLIDGIHRVTALDCALVGFDQNHDGAVGQQYSVDINNYATLLPHKDKVVKMQVYFLPEFTPDDSTGSSTLLKKYQELSFEIQEKWGKQMPHTFRETIHHEMTHLAKRCEEEKVPYLWECLGILFQTELSSENGRVCSEEEKETLRRGIDVNSPIGSDFVSTMETLSGGSMDYQLPEKYISCWVERMSDLIIDVLEASRHMIELGLTFKPSEHPSILKELMFQQSIRGTPTRNEYTIFPFRDIGSTLGGKLDWWKDPDRVASAMFDHENKPFSGVISDKRERTVARNRLKIPGPVVILSQILLWSRSCEEDYRKLMQLFSSHNSSYLQIRTGTGLDALRWTTNFYHSVTDSVQYSYPPWKKGFFVSADDRHPLQNNPASVIYLCLLSSAIASCSKFFLSLGIKASWQNWEGALEKSVSSIYNAESTSVTPNVDTYLAFSHAYRMEYEKAANIV